MTQVLEGRASSSRKVCHDFNGLKSLILDVELKLDEFFLNSRVPVQPATVPGTFPVTNGETQGKKERFQIDPELEV